MSTSLRIVAVALLTSVSAFAVGCAEAPVPDEEQGETTANITGSLEQARLCAVKDAYIKADVSDFTSVKAADLPFDAPALPPNTKTSYSSFDVPGVGKVFYAETKFTFTEPKFQVLTSTLFYDASGNVMLVASPSEKAMPFFMATGEGALDCGTK